MYRHTATGSQLESDFLSHLPSSSLPLLSARPAVTFPAKEVAAMQPVPSYTA